MYRLNSLKRTALKSSIVVMVVFVFALTVSAYTVVMRGGRRVEIPSQFVVTAATLTYEVSPGVQVTLATAAIDIPATEKANHEVAGSFIHRLQTGTEAAAEQSSTQASSPARRTITNRDLESARRRRRDSELAYENRRKQLGLPSVEESRRRAAAEADSIRLELEQKRVASEQSENYWRQRATALRTEIAALDAELAYVRTRLDEGPWPNGWTGGWSGSTGWSFGTVGRGFLFSSGGSRSFGNSAGFPRGTHRPNIYSYERSALITHFNELGAARAGLNARWRELEDEARRAGAPPGWLRP